MKLKVRDMNLDPEWARNNLTGIAAKVTANPYRDVFSRLLDQYVEAAERNTGNERRTHAEKPN